MSVISLNYMDEDNSLVGELNKWEQGNAEFAQLNQLYEAATLSLNQVQEA